MHGKYESTIRMTKEKLRVCIELPARFPDRVERAKRIKIRRLAMVGA